MYCARVIAFILGVIFTACGTCGQLFPLFRGKETEDQSATRWNYWYVEEVSGTKAYQYIERYYWSDAGFCDKVATMWQASAALAIIGTAFGFLGTMVIFGHLFVRVKFCCCCTAMVFCFIAFACLLVSFALVLSLYLNDMCSPDDRWPKAQRVSKIAEGFPLIVTASGGFLITGIVELFS